MFNRVNELKGLITKEYMQNQDINGNISKKWVVATDFNAFRLYFKDAIEQMTDNKNIYKRTGFHVRGITTEQYNTIGSYYKLLLNVSKKCGEREIYLEEMNDIMEMYSEDSEYDMENDEEHLRFWESSLPDNKKNTQQYRGTLRASDNIKLKYGQLRKLISDDDYEKYDELIEGFRPDHIFDIFMGSVQKLYSEAGAKRNFCEFFLCDRERIEDFKEVFSLYLINRQFPLMAFGAEPIKNEENKSIITEVYLDFLEMLYKYQKFEIKEEIDIIIEITKKNKDYREILLIAAFISRGYMKSKVIFINEEGLILCKTTQDNEEISECYNRFLNIFNSIDRNNASEQVNIESRNVISIISTKKMVKILNKGVIIQLQGKSERMTERLDIEGERLELRGWSGKILQYLSVLMAPEHYLENVVSEYIAENK
jgi:hypothetical protein